MTQKYLIWDENIEVPSPQSVVRVAPRLDYSVPWSARWINCEGFYWFKVIFYSLIENMLCFAVKTAF